MKDNLDKQLAGRYAVERELGRGGMATVWLARDLRHDRPIALKVLHPELAGAIGVERFVREVRLTARLQHPNIVPVLDSGILAGADGTPLPWYAMPFIAGESLRARLSREQHLPIESALRITDEVAGALSAAHQVGVVHRDIKPENVLLTGDRVYVVDFGIAKALVDTGDERLTSTGLAIGTPAYMSPEQGSAAAVDPRSDQYSLACLLYEMLAGEPPFTGPTSQAIVARRFAEPARPLRPVRSAVPAGIERAVLRALERIPADRFDSVAAFAAALRAPDPAEPRRSNRRTVSTVLLGAGLIATVALAGWLLGRPGRRAADRPARDPEAVALYERGLREYDRRTPAGAVDAVAAFTAALQRDSGYAAAWNGLAQTYVRAYQRLFALPGIARDSMLRLAVAAADRAIAAEPGSSDAWMTRSMVSRMIDPTDTKTSLRSARQAIALDSGNAPAWHNLAISLADSGDLDAALEAWRQSVRRSPTYTQSLAFLGLGHYWRRQYDSAAVWADSAIAVEPNYVLGRSTAGYVEVERGNYSRAIAAFEAARRLSSDVEVVNSLAGRALAEARAGDRSRARATLREAESLAVRFKPTPLHTAVNLAQAYAALGDAARAVTWLKRYAPAQDLHFQLHLRCDPPFDPIAEDRRLQALLLSPRRPDRGC